MQNPGPVHWGNNAQPHKLYFPSLSNTFLLMPGSSNVSQVLQVIAVELNSSLPTPLFSSRFGKQDRRFRLVRPRVHHCPVFPPAGVDAAATPISTSRSSALLRSRSITWASICLTTTPPHPASTPNQLRCSPNRTVNGLTPLAKPGQSVVSLLCAINL